MENQVNQRIILLKKHLDWDNQTFCTRTGLSSATLWNIQKGGNIQPRTLKNIIENTGVHKEWLINGTGEMIAWDANSNTHSPKEAATAENPYRDALVSELRQQVAFLQSVVAKLTGAQVPPAANFLKPLQNPDLQEARIVKMPAHNAKRKSVKAA